MHEIPFGTRSGLDVTPVSIGAMRFPEDCLDAVDLIRHAIDAGLRYIDTSRGYGDSEFKLGAALKGGYREKVILSSKSSPWIKKIRDDDDGSADSVRRRIEETLLRLDVDKIDFYQIWNITDEDSWVLATKKGGMVEGIQKAQAEGLVGHIGFTTHAPPKDLVERYLEQATWAEVVLATYNLLDKTYAPVLEKAHELGIGTIVMNPVGGGKFTGESDVMMTLAKQVGATSVADLAIRYVLGNPNVDTILCGLAKTADVDDTIASANRGGFAPEAVATIDSYFESLSKENVRFCTGCKYCMPCPAGIAIPQILNSVYEARFLGLVEGAKGSYRWHVRNVKPEACTDCGACEEKCTQKLPIREELNYAKTTLGT